MAISFQNHQIEFRLPGKVKLKTWMRQVLRQEGRKEGQLSFVFTSDEELHKYNLQYLSHDTLTDIITFDESEGMVVAGDIMISVERVKENAQTYGSGFDNELRRVMAHGLLHLCGYSDKTEAEQQAMRKKENEALQLFAQLP